MRSTPNSLAEGVCWFAGRLGQPIEKIGEEEIPGEASGGRFVLT